MEVVHRYIGSKGSWDLKDTLLLKLTYFEQKENYQLLTINAKPALRSYEEVGGAISEGEFGSILRQIFEPQSAAEFRWDHWTTLRKRPAHVLAFRVKPANSTYSVTYGLEGGERQSAIVGQHGYAYVDGETSEILRIRSDADNIPDDLPILTASTLLDYDFSNIGGHRFLLPLRADVRLTSVRLKSRNEVIFRDYRKFNAEATISFDPK